MLHTEGLRFPWDPFYYGKGIGACRGGDEDMFPRDWCMKMALTCTLPILE